MTLRLIAARGRSGQIGRNNGLLWRLPEDMRLFKARTMGHALIMGRKTWDSMGGRPLPGRVSIVVSRAARPATAGISWTSSIEDAIRLATLDDTAPFCIGGAEIYAQALPHASELLLTEIDDDTPGDAFFPALDPAEWREVEAFDLETRPAARFHRLVRKGIEP